MPKNKKGFTQYENFQSPPLADKKSFSTKLKNSIGNSSTGFTLIEMLVVVAIIGILSSLLLTTLGPARDKAKDARIIQEVNQIRNLAETLYDGDYDAFEAISEGQPLEQIQNPVLRGLVIDIFNNGGEVVIAKPQPPPATKYIVYSNLNTKVGVEPDLQIQYYCIDSSGKVSFTTGDLSQALSCP